MNPSTIVDQQVPLLSGGVNPSTGNASNPVTANQDVELPNTHVDQKFPLVVIAQETQSQSLDTSTKRIKGEYEFESLGAIKIGQFSPGVSGEIDISPSGIIGVDNNDNVTFSIDGTTGDAIFRGTVQAGAFDVIDSNGLISSSNFTTANLVVGGIFSTANNTYTDVTGSAFTINTTRDVKVQISMFVYMQIDNPNFQTNGYFADAILYDSFLSGLAIGTLSTPGIPATTAAGAYRTAPMPVEITEIITVATGTHNYKLQLKANGGGTASLGGFSVNIMILGT